MSVMTAPASSASTTQDRTREAPPGCHPFMALPLELRLLIWEAFGSEPRVLEYREDTCLIEPAREYRHSRPVGLGVCAEARTAIRALLRPFPHPHDIRKGSRTSPSALECVPASDVVYLPPPVYRSRIGAWDSPWTTKPGIRNVGVHWSVLPDERRIVEALKGCSLCFTDMTKLVVFIEFKPLPQPEQEAGNGGNVRLFGHAEDEFRLPPLFSEAQGLMDDFWTWGELRLAIEKVRRRLNGMPEVEGMLYYREVEDLTGR
ncbi:hypothetical protein CH063_07489 [Colletotrichum higginsianum]|uniref:2EXR domain-containing protein n=2 Tax=Colletotrichum higginsianum TaxID=80884 RepID=H1V6C5_COLHI|nr:hypothetical protein CH63R_11371 [Colletotrichum higginsianum IMI 349063]OBR04668.1 hypothetical protein CH63R_11371 [Colletotrichum higginsianum IMI 349063]TIC93674.1 hypothetical protein CH35J_009102 [Colletotrichum higginsianum]GJC99305.1 hypothetical protein ColKHC_08131 [Colletotrichum higginsianum]CCF35777.1 hypothetical protein CH063_07489 [Colletotrichum higginsianum]